MGGVGRVHVRGRRSGALAGKPRAAFRGGFLGVRLVRLVDAGADRRGERGGSCRAGRGLAKQLRRQLGAPDLAAARAAAEEEVAFAASLCDHPQDTLIAVRRTFEDGDIREAFRTLRPRGERKPMRAFSFLDVEGEEEEAGETVDLAKSRPRETKRTSKQLTPPSRSRP